MIHVADVFNRGFNNEGRHSPWCLAVWVYHQLAGNTQDNILDYINDYFHFRVVLKIFFKSL